MTYYDYNPRYSAQLVTPPTTPAIYCTGMPSYVPNDSHLWEHPSLPPPEVAYPSPRSMNRASAPLPAQPDMNHIPASHSHTSPVGGMPYSPARSVRLICTPEPPPNIILPPLEPVVIPPSPRRGSPAYYVPPPQDLGDCHCEPQGFCKNSKNGCCQSGRLYKTYPTGRDESVQPHPLLVWDANCNRLGHDIRQNPKHTLLWLTPELLSEPATSPPVCELRIWIKQVPDWPISIRHHESKYVTLGETLAAIYSQLVLTPLSPSEMTTAERSGALHTISHNHRQRMRAVSWDRTVQGNELMRVDWINQPATFVGLHHDPKLYKWVGKKTIKEFGTNFELYLGS